MYDDVPNLPENNVYRWYEFGAGRFASSDPLGLVDGPNPYRYAANNPLTTYDLWGLASCPQASSSSSYICCDGNGGFEVCAGRPGGNETLRDCVQQHELDHVDWYQENLPCACAGREKGECLFRLTVVQRDQSECRGYEVEYRCLAKARGGMTGSQLRGILLRQRTLKNKAKRDYGCDVTQWDRSKP